MEMSESQPAFPSTYPVPSGGMSYRQWLVGQALTGILHAFSVSKSSLSSGEEATLMEDAIEGGFGAGIPNFVDDQGKPMTFSKLVADTAVELADACIAAESKR